MVQSESLQIYWHDSHPIYSVCFQPVKKNEEAIGGRTRRLFTSGGDNKVRVWQLNENEEGKIDSIDFLSSLTQHEQAVNVCRFNEQGDILATGGDDGLLLLWKQNETVVREFGMDEEEFADLKESWTVWKRLRSGSGLNAEIYDISWNASGTCVAVASLDHTVRVFDVEKGCVVGHISEHNHYVQGIVWDPLGEYLVSQSADRSVVVCRVVYEGGQVSGLELVNKIVKCELPRRKEGEGQGPGSGERPGLDFESSRVGFLFHNETLPSFFRRLCMSPCGSLLCVPAGIQAQPQVPAQSQVQAQPEAGAGPDSAESQSVPLPLASQNTLYIYTRGSLGSNKPVFSLPFLEKPALVARFNPVLFEGASRWVLLPYKLVFAVATTNEVLVYDTQETAPIAVVGNLHYSPITDLAWSADGRLLMVSSTDGFCSYVNFGKSLGNALGKDLGTPVPKAIPEAHSKQGPQAQAQAQTIPSQAQTIPSQAQTIPSQAQTSPSQTPATAKAKRRVQPTLVGEIPGE
ncbi:chromatin assembly factor 1 subunit p60 [Kluyveromyces marxianus]|uniref:Chromatin assembly factor 1 subunit p60 n=1 Tax=Kluyveromyces marxianus TaxID=4911 RepID=A0ABX6ET39_KLUMA|nr:chromatin assembly factor 1 subunit p60 [Kluyveromyces marxianus]